MRKTFLASSMAAATLAKKELQPLPDTRHLETSDPKKFVDRMVMTLVDAKLYGYLKTIGPAIDEGRDLPSLTKWMKASKELIGLEIGRMAKDGVSTTTERKAYISLFKLMELTTTAFWDAVNNILSNPEIKEAYNI